MWRSSRELGGWVGCMGGTNRGKQSKNFPHLLARKRETKNRLSYTYFFFGCLCFILFALQCHKFVDVCLTLRGERGVKGVGRCTKGEEYRWEEGARSQSQSESQFYCALSNGVENWKMGNHIQWMHFEMSAWCRWQCLGLRRGSPRNDWQMNNELWQVATRVGAALSHYLIRRTGDSR